MTDPSAMLPPPPPESLPPPGHQPADATTSSRRLAPIALFAVTAGIAGLLAVLIGAAIGFVAFGAHASTCSPSDGWCELGSAFLGIFAGGAAGLITYIVAGVVIVFRHRERGQRARAIAAHLAAPPLLVLVLSILSAITESLG